MTHDPLGTLHWNGQDWEFSPLDGPKKVSSELLDAYEEMFNHFNIHDGEFGSLWADDDCDTEWGEKADAIIRRIKELKSGNH